TALLTHSHTRNGRSRTITLLELHRICEGLDRTTELLKGDQVEVGNIVSILLVALSARGRLGDGGETIPRNTRRICTEAVSLVEDAVIHTRFIQALTSDVPLDSSHSTS